MNIVEAECPHFSEKDGKPVLTKKTAIILHDTGGKTAEGTIAWFLNEESKVSSHYLVGKDGKIWHMVPDEYVAWHAGKSSLFGVADVNSFSYGIEIVDNDDNDPYPEPQIEALLDLVVMLAHRDKIPMNRIVGHQHIAPGRKVDPGADFPWYDFLNTVGARVAEKEFGEDV